MNANAATMVVPGTADPWLANATVDNLGTPEPPDYAPGQSPVLAGWVAPGNTVSWLATGEAGHPGDVSGPSGALYSIISRTIGANNGINDLTAPICSLIGVWAYPGGGGIAFYMGASGTAVVPAGADQLFLGMMDGYGWANNIGQFDVTVNGVPDGALTISMLGLALTGLGWLRRKV